MIPNHRFRKTCILIGGSGELGRVLTKRFAKTPLFRWNVFNIDTVENPDAQKNFLIDAESQEPYHGEVIKKLRKEVADYWPEYDAMINLVGIDKSPTTTPLASDSYELFD